MVGVPGKFKGCNTCRTRRVKCDNLRPDCQKCIDSGRSCGGYTRETIFILVGKPKVSPPPEKVGIPRPVEVQHEFGSTVVTIADARSAQIPCIALHANFAVLVPTPERRDDFFTLPTLNHKSPESVHLSHDGEFSLRAACFFHPGPPKEESSRRRASSGSRPSSSAGAVPADPQADTKMDNGEGPMLLFVYEQTTSRVGDFGTFKNVMGGTSDVIKQQGVSRFQKFPDHYFFTRIYRPAAIFHAMSHRKTTFLSDPQWWSTPWEEIPKTDMDSLLDIQVQLPGIFERAARLEEFPASRPRKLKAKDLLSNCEKIDKMFGDWYNELCERSEESLIWPCQPKPQSSWRGNPNWKPRDNLQRFSDVEFEFADTQAALLHIYYWAGLCLLYKTMNIVHQICVEPIPSPSPPQPIRYSGVSNTGYPTEPPASFASQQFPGPTSQQLVPNQPQPFIQGAFPFAPVPQHYPQDQSYFQSIAQSFGQTTPQMFVPISQPYYQPEVSFFYNGTQSATQPPVVPYHDVSYQQAFLQGAPSPSHVSVQSTSQTATPTPPSMSTSFSAELKFSDSAIVNLAQTICQAVPYTLRNIVDIHGPDHLSWPLSNALQTYRSHGPEFEMEALWCEQVMEILREEGRLLSSQMTSKSWKEFKAVEV